MKRSGAFKHGVGFIAATAIFFVSAAKGYHTDSIIPEEFTHSTPLELSSRSAKKADAQAAYLEALFEEDNEGPDKALDAKERVLLLDPGFCDLAVEVAQYHLSRGQIPEAIAILKDAAKAAPHHPAPPLALATIYLRHLQKPALAEKYANQAVVANPGEAATYTALCEVYRASRQFQKIDTLLQKASKRESSNPQFWLGLAEIRLKDYPFPATAKDSRSRKIIADLLEKAAQCGAGDAKIMARIGDCQVLCGEPARAAAYYQKAITLDPDDDTIRPKLATCLVQTGAKKEAIEILEEIIKENPLDLAAYDQLARIQIEAGNIPSALTAMRQGLLLAPVDPRRHEDIIRLCFHAGDSEAALQYATEAEKKFPYIVGFTLFRAIALSQNKDHAAAMIAFERTLVEAANSNPELLDSTFFMSYGTAAEQAGHRVKAAELLKRAIVLNPSNAAACNYLGYMWADQNKNLAEAEHLILHALKLDPQSGAYRDSLGWVWFRQGKYSEALAELLHAAEMISPADPVVYEHIGDTYEKLGKTAGALMNWKKALQLDQDNSALAEKIENHSSRIVQKPEPSENSGTKP